MRLIAFTAAGALSMLAAMPIPMSAQAVPCPAPTPEALAALGPPVRIAPTGKTAYSVDVMTAEGMAVFKAQWRNMDAKVVEAPPRPNAEPWKVSYEVQPKAGEATFSDASWPVIEAKALADRRGGGGVYMTWFRTNVTMPAKIGAFDTAGSKAVLHITVDDYAEVWVNGLFPRAICTATPNAIAGFNLPNRVVLSDAVKPGETVQVAILAINGPISMAPLNGSYFREARIEFYR
jgi:hypothetical protein